MTSQRKNRKPNKHPFWKRWLYWGLFAFLLALTAAFFTLMLAVPFMYETEARWGLAYGAGMSLILMLICADSARRIFRKLRPKS